MHTLIHSADTAHTKCKVSILRSRRRATPQERGSVDTCAHVYITSADTVHFL